jgi:hypothetical protein
MNNFRITFITNTRCALTSHSSRASSLYLLVFKWRTDRLDAARARQISFFPQTHLTLYHFVPSVWTLLTA